ncbi:thiol-disulfide oxidoreductase [Sphingomonas sp. IW22]|uniref:thiol-disulfide oxidoreductase n=1 Tax=Sphingomonas sp. IW22 TaxID=3242489 RepID=UPI003522BEE9
MTLQPTWIGAVGRRLTSADADVSASDGLISFSVMWAVALTFSAVSHHGSLMLANGLVIALIEYAVLASCVALILQPRRLSLLAILAAAMAAQYVFRLPVASNNQTIAFFMNLAIMTIVSVAWLKHGDVETTRAEIYERLRIVARLLLATMYFYGIFHKINVDFLDPDASCAVALYKPLTHAFGLEESLIGRYGSIAATFIVETITIVSLFWRRYFAVGLIVGLVFHYIIPISAYSWYMDFSSLVFALYTLSVPREVSIAFYSRGRALLRQVPSPLTGGVALVGLGVLFVAATLLATLLREQAGDLAITDRMAWHSAWIVVWAVVGGVVMVLLSWAALEALPYRPVGAPRQPLWVYAIPAVLFVTCLSPYLGLKTESSIAMFSNLHTEGGTTNHLLFARPPYIAGYQNEVATITGSSNATMQSMADRNLGMVRFQLERWMVYHPSDWVSFTLDGQRFERATASSFPLRPPSFLERRLLVFKPVDVSRPKMCTH